jgi:hypothetical protein
MPFKNTRGYSDKTEYSVLTDYTKFYLLKTTDFTDYSEYSVLTDYSIPVSGCNLYNHRRTLQLSTYSENPPTVLTTPPPSTLTTSAYSDNTQPTQTTPFPLTHQQRLVLLFYLRGGGVEAGATTSHRRSGASASIFSTHELLFLKLIFKSIIGINRLFGRIFGKTVYSE